MIPFAVGAVLSMAAIGATDEVAGATAARFREVTPSLASVHFVARNESPSGGSADWEADLLGVFVSADGLVLVPGSIKPEKRIRTTLVSVTVTTTDGAVFDAAFVTKDSDLGVAFLRIREPRAEGFPFVRFDGERELDVGDQALAFGILPESLERARRCELVRVCAALTRPRRIFLVNEALADNIGSPVVRIDGGVVGVVATPRLVRSAASAPLGEDGAPSNVAPPCILPAAAIAKRIADLPHDDVAAPRPWVGIRTQPIGSATARTMGAPDGEGFFMIARVFPDSPAARAGLREEDQILACAGERLRPSGDADADLLAEALGRHHAGETIDVLVRRAGVETSVRVSLESAPTLKDSARVIRNESFGLTVREATYFDVVDVPTGIDRAEATGAVVTTTVDRAGFAGLAGLEAGDLLLRLDGRPIGGLEAFSEAIDRAVAAKAHEIVFFLLRASTTQFVTVRPDWKSGG